MRCVYLDLDGTLLGPRASLLRGEGDGFALEGVRALQACDRAGAEVVLYSGRRQRSVFECARLIGSTSFIFELGCGLVVDGELEWLTDGIEPSEEAGSIYEQIDASGAPAVLLKRFAGRLEYHTPWSVGREVSHLFRGAVEVDEAQRELDSAGLEWLRFVDNGVVGAASSSSLQAEVLHAYHLIPSAASKARAVARHMQARGYVPADCIAVGDSREDLGVAGAVHTFWLVANALERDPSLGDDVRILTSAGRGAARVRVASAAYGAGVYEAVVTSLAERG